MKDSIDDLITQFKESETVRSLHRYFSEKSTMEILGVDRDENAHSNFLAWLFENRVTGKVACKLLISMLNGQTLEVNNVQVIREDFVSGKYVKDGSGIHKCTKHEADEKIVKGRSDLLIKVNNGQTFVVIENKVHSKEECKWDFSKDVPGDKPQKEDSNEKITSLWQTRFYHDYYSNIYGGKVLFAFLSLPKQAGPKSDDFTHITYQDILDNILVPILGSHFISGHPLEEHKIREYIKALGIRYSQDDVMAVDNRLRNFLTPIKDKIIQLYDPKKWESSPKELIEFWNKKSSGGIVMRDILRLILKTVYSMGWINICEDTKKTKYQYKLEEGCGTISGKNALFKWIVRMYIVKKYSNMNSIPTVEQLQQVFPASLHGKTNSAKNSRPTDNNIIVNEEKPDYKNVFPIGQRDGDTGFWEKFIESNTIKSNTSIYICQTGWDGPELMSRLIKYVKENIPELEDIEILEIPQFLQKGTTTDNKE